MIVRLLLLAALLLPAAAGAQRLWSIEGAGAVVLRDDPQGSLFDEELAWGARAGLALHPLLGLPEGLQLGIGLLWYGGGHTAGTSAVQVQRSLHSFALPVQLGWELGWRPFEVMRLAPYLTGGPAATLAGTSYLVADPVALEQGIPPQEKGVSGLQAGGVYGLGLAIGHGDTGLGFTARLEALRLHRGPNADLALGLGLGAAF
ncbi:hypothetical protein [Vulgatibacter sp.]|uniref:hypothetical protein n=1 Tax=Vulgatibacter sp. TaxID=1971226 RepID=UPI003565AA05